MSTPVPEKLGPSSKMQGPLAKVFTFIRLNLPSCIWRCRSITLALFLIGLLMVLALSTLFLDQHPNRNIILISQFALIISLLMYFIVITWRDFIKPIMDLDEWTLHIRSGELQAKMAVPEHGEFVRLAHDINDLGSMLESLSKDTEEQLARYTTYTEQKTLSLSILYDVAASINISHDLNDLLSRFLRTLTEVVNARAGAVRLLNHKHELELVASLGFDPDLIKKEKTIPASACVCGKLDQYDSLVYQESIQPCKKLAGEHRFFDREDTGLIVVPLQYQGKTLGVYNLFVNRKEFVDNEDFRELFTSIGRHLGMAIAKSRLEEASKQFSIIQERNRLSNELHDSLAQTLTSIRFQIRVLDETLHQGDDATTWQQMEKLENTIDEANIELRGLISHFKAPIRRKQLIPAIDDLVTRFRTESDIHIFFQQTLDKELELNDKTHLEVVRITQEALTNIRKHSEANVARVMLRQLDNQRIELLIEDDGVGLPKSVEANHPGEKIGLGIMSERAQRIDAHIEIESETGEGTRIRLRFSLNNEVVEVPPHEIRVDIENWMKHDAP